MRNFTIQNLANKGNVGDGWEDYLEGRERMDLIKTVQLQWKNLNILDTGRLDEFLDHTGSAGDQIDLSLRGIRSPW
jgi:hypothetical protein